jgi:phosphinothricin acetyltransferase
MSLDERRKWFEAHDDGHPILVAERDGQVAAFGALSKFHERSAYRRTTENAVYVRHDFVGQGIGSAMLAALIDRAKAIGHHAIIALIDSEQEASIRLHEKHGFVRCGHLKQVGFKMGRWLDVIYLEYLIR